MVDADYIPQCVLFLWLSFSCAHGRRESGQKLGVGYTKSTCVYSLLTLKKYKLLWNFNIKQLALFNFKNSFELNIC